MPVSALLGVSTTAGAGTTQPDRLVANTAWMCARSALRLILQGAYFVAVARVLGAAGYGEFIAVGALTVMLAPFGCFGTGNLLIRDVSREPAAMAQSWWTALATTVLSGLPMIAALLALAAWILPGTPPLLVLLIGIADLVFAQLADICGKAFQAERRLDLTATIDTLLSAVKLVAALGLCLLVSKPTALAWAGFYAGANLLGAAVGIGLVVARHRVLPPRFSVSVRTLREGLYFALSLWAQAVQKDIDKMLIVRLSGPLAAGVYAAAFRVVEMAFTPIFSLLAATYPGFFRHGVSGLRGTIAYARPLVLVGGLFGLAGGLVLTVAAPVLPLLLGDGFEGSVEAVQWLALTPLLKSLHYVAGDVLTGAGFQRLRTCLQLGVGAAAIGMAVWAIPLYSWRGAAGAAVVSNVLLVVASWVAIAVMRRRS